MYSHAFTIHYGMVHNSYMDIFDGTMLLVDNALCIKLVLCYAIARREWLEVVACYGYIQSLTLYHTIL